MSEDLDDGVIQQIRAHVSFSSTSFLVFSFFFFFILFLFFYTFFSCQVRVIISPSVCNTHIYS